MFLRASVVLLIATTSIELSVADDPAVIVEQMELAVDLSERGDPAGAAKAAETAYEAGRRVYSPDSEELINLSKFAGLLYFEAHDWKKSRQFFAVTLHGLIESDQQDSVVAKEIRSWVFLTEKWSHCSSMELKELKRAVQKGHEARSLVREQKYSDALPIYVDCRDVFVRYLGQQSMNYCSCMASIAQCYEGLGDYKCALKSYEEAFEQACQLFGGSHPESVSIATGYAEFLAKFDEEAAAELLNGIADSVRNTVGGGEHFEAVKFYRSRANYLYDHGQVNLATDMLLEAHGILMPLLEIEVVPEVRLALLRELGVLKSDLALYREGESDMTAAVSGHMGAIRFDVQQNLSKSFAHCVKLRRYGRCLQMIGDYEGARLQFVRARELQNELGIEYSAFENDAIDFAWLAIAEGDIQEAIRLLREEAEVLLEQLWQFSPVMSDRQFDNMYARGRLIIDTLLTISDSPSDSASLYEVVAPWKGLRNERQRRRVLLSADSDLARELRQTLADLFSMSTVSDADLSNERDSRRNKLVKRKEQLEATLAQDVSAPSQFLAAGVFERLTEEQASLVDYVVYSHFDLEEREQVAGSIGIGLKKTEEGFEVTALTPDGAAAESGVIREGDVILSLRDHNGKWQDCSDLSVAVAASNIRGMTGTSVMLTIRHRGDEDSVERSVLRTATKYQRRQNVIRKDYVKAFVLKPSGRIDCLDLGPYSRFESLIAAWRIDTGDGRRGASTQRFAVRKGAAIRKLLVDPVVKFCDSELKTILISFDRSLGSVPIAALPVANGDRFLVEEFTFGRVTLPWKLQSTRRTGNSGVTNGKAVLIGDIDYCEEDNSEGSQRVIWNPLASAKSELDLVTSALPEGTDVIKLTGAKATKSAFLQEGRTAKLVHVATHGFFAAENESAAGAAVDSVAARDAIFGSHFERVVSDAPELLTFLVFAGANSSTDALLSCGELSAASIPAALVVLSACDTAIGDVRSSAGQHTMQQAFQSAGAKNVISSCWSVDDRATEYLFQSFYRQWSQPGVSPMVALRHAQLELLNRTAAADLTGGKMKGAPSPGTRTLPNQPVVNDAIAEPRVRLSPEYWAAFVININ